jgi:hypothetical protein
MRIATLVPRIFRTCSLNWRVDDRRTPWKAFGRYLVHKFKVLGTDERYRNVQ